MDRDQDLVLVTLQEDGCMSPAGFRICSPLKMCCGEKCASQLGTEGQLALTPCRIWHLRPPHTTLPNQPPPPCRTPHRKGKKSNAYRARIRHLSSLARSGICVHLPDPASAFTCGIWHLSSLAGSGICVHFPDPASEFHCQIQPLSSLTRSTSEFTLPSLPSPAITLP